jgi:hypothetical protein
VKAVTWLGLQLREPRSFALLGFVAAGECRAAPLTIEQNYPANAPPHRPQTGGDTSADHHGNINSALHTDLPKYLAT